jgi:hypothetical protein
MPAVQRFHSGARMTDFLTVMAVSMAVPLSYRAGGS